MARYVIYGAGGVGCLIGGRLHLAGHEVDLIARGAHAEAMAKQGLHLRSPAGEHLLRLPVLTPDTLDLAPGDTVVLTTKSQDSSEALERVAAHAPAGVAILCAQNGVGSERLALRLFEHVYGALVIVYAAMNAPGTVSYYSSDSAGVIDIGRYPRGEDHRATRIAGDLSGAGFRSVARTDIMRWKRGKLLISLGNVVGALCLPDDQPAALLNEAREEAERCLAAAGLDFVSMADLMAGPLGSLSLGLVGGAPFPGSSTFQGLARGSEKSEADYFNGEIALLGRSYGIPTPVNSFLQQFMRGCLRDKLPPGSLSSRTLMDAYMAAEGPDLSSSTPRDA